MIGLIGGVSAEATQIYYRHLNAHARAALGGQHTANVLFYMLDYGVMIGHYNDRDWPAFTREVVKAAEALKRGGATALAITSGTTHVGADAAAEATGLPLIHMLDSLADAMAEKGSVRPLLLGTPWVMSGEFFGPALSARYNGSPIVPTQDDIDGVGRVIFDELVNGKVLETSQREMTELVKRYAADGADGVILGCTELCMILSQRNLSTPVFDVTAIHAKAIAAHLFAKPSPAKQNEA